MKLTFHKLEIKIMSGSILVLKILENMEIVENPSCQKKKKVVR